MSGATRDDAGRRWPLSRIVGVAVLVLLLFSVGAVIAGGIALISLHDARNRVINVIDPATLATQQLDNALVNQETGVRGYALSGQQSFLTPYTDGVAEETTAINSLRLLAGQLPPKTISDLNSVTAQANFWRTHYAQPTIAQVARTGKPVLSPDVITGKTDFDALRTTVAVLQADVTSARSGALATLNDASTSLDAVFIAVAIGLALIVALLALGLRATAIRPLHRLAAQVRQVAGGDFDHEVTVRGPREVTHLAADVNTMRERILQELAATQENNTILQAHATELQRSNSELEQFAYVASHDLQEPLRKVASFTQLLQRRYAGKLDARADQYIEFAVDGAKRMQALINDLLAYSRVGRSEREPALVSSDTALTQARANLAEQIEETGATIETGHLPLVLAELPLLIAVFQNLLSNALKFSGEKPPRIVVTVRRDEPFWLFSFSDNGIGIEPEYAERIFVIFQRLNERSAYAGTGIGLSMTRKIIEYFGGRIWLDTAFVGGTRFCFTLPMPQEIMTPDLADPLETPDKQADPLETPDKQADPLETSDNQNAAALGPAPEPAAEPEDRQDEETDDRLR
jgi:signal transduction histidine kinase